MCEYSPGCDKVTDPMARILSENPREDMALVLVYCPKRYHTLAAVYDKESLGGLVICTPHMKARSGSLFILEPGEDPNASVHWHPSLRRLDTFAEDKALHGRCRCGTWHYRPSQALDVVEQVHAGTWRGIEPDTFVKVRNHETEQVSELPQDYAEKYVLPEGGHSIVGRSPRSDRLRRPYILGGYVRMADTPK